MATARVGDTLDYARLYAPPRPEPDAHRDRLIEVGAIRVFADIVSGQRFDRDIDPRIRLSPRGIVMPHNCRFTVQRNARTQPDEQRQSKSSAGLTH